MPIPALNEDGILPEGIHDCSLTEIQERFGQFQRVDRRCRLFERLESFVQDVRLSGIADALIVDGSFVSDKDDPDDIDLILVVHPDHDFSAVLRPLGYNVVSRRDVRRRFGFDVVVARNGKAELDEYIAFFAQVRYRTDIRKGLLRISL